MRMTMFALSARIKPAGVATSLSVHVSFFSLVVWLQSAKCRAVQMHWLGLAQLTGCFAGCMCIAVSFKGAWLVGLLIGKLFCDFSCT